MNGVNGIPPVSPCLGGCIFDEVRDVEDECFYFEVDGSSQGRQEVVCGRHVWYEEANDDEEDYLQECRFVLFSKQEDEVSDEEEEDDGETQSGRSPK